MSDENEHEHEHDGPVGPAGDDDREATGSAGRGDRGEAGAAGDPDGVQDASVHPDPAEADGEVAQPGQDVTSIYDPGLQPERTLLSWRRTCLAFGVASLVGMRFTVEQLGLFGAVAGLVGAGLAVLAYVLTASGYQRAQDSLLGLGQLARDGKPMLVGTAAVLCIGLVCASYLVVNLIR
ncbi:DUF202 domain-containing protein [Brachybacterium sp. GCM10030267]|uniref:DUF202 domain-containing protein n=1 Tax=unclassified Brachybacterium TaxID=2623841 RepID=UPI0036245EFF